MEQVVVPQFLDVEDKIIGPVSVRQFIEMIIGGGLIFIFYKIFDFSLFLITGILTGGVTLVVAFAKINGQRFHDFLLNLFVTLRRPVLKVWRREDIVGEKTRNREIQKKTEADFSALPPSPIRSSISELSLIVDTGGVYKGEK